MPDVCTPLGFITGRVSIDGLPGTLPNISIHIVAGAVGGGHGADVWVNVNPTGTPYSLPLTPGKYQVYAAYGSAQSSSQTVDVSNGKPSEVNFCFGRDSK